MAELYLLPHQKAVQRWQKERFHGSLLPFSLPGLIADILRSGGAAYRENRVLERTAVFEGIWNFGAELVFFQPLLSFPGLGEDLHWLYQQLGLGEAAWDDLPGSAAEDVAALYSRYRGLLEQWHVLDSAGQAERALRYARAWRDANHIDKIIIDGVLELAPLHQTLLDVLAEGISVVKQEPGQPSAPQAAQFDRPPEEVEAMAAALRDALQAGTAPRDLAVAVVDRDTYMPIIEQVFRRQGLPWAGDAAKLADVPLGRAVLALLDAIGSEMSKKHWQRLTVDGWGWPFDPDRSAWRKLKLAPPLKGIPQWRQYMGGEHILGDMLQEVHQWSAAAAQCRTLAEYASWLRSILSRYAPEQWLRGGEDQWAALVTSWDGLHGILDTLDSAEIPVSFDRFVHLLQLVMGEYTLPQRKQFRQSIHVGSLQEIAAGGFALVCIPGMQEAVFPRRPRRHWLAGDLGTGSDEQLWEHLLATSGAVWAGSSREDSAGKSQLPSPLLSQTSQRRIRLRAMDGSRDGSVTFGSGHLRDWEAVERIRRQVLNRPQSPSRLNRYVDCPYQYFCSQVLALEEEEEAAAELTALEEGSLVHAVLQRFWDHFGSSAVLPDAQQAQAWVAAAAAEETERFGQPLSGVALRRLQFFIRRDLETMPDAYRPQFLETGFSELELPVKGGVVRLTGKIDRVDVNGAEDTAVILDYKTGSNPPPKEIQEVQHLQLPVYYLAARQLWPHLTIVGTAFYSVKESNRAGLWCKPYHSEFGLSGGKNMWEQQAWDDLPQKFEQEIRNCVEGILAGQFPVAPRDNRICCYCSFNNVCRREVY